MATATRPTHVLVVTREADAAAAGESGDYLIGVVYAVGDVSRWPDPAMRPGWGDYVDRITSVSADFAGDAWAEIDAQLARHGMCVVGADPLERTGGGPQWHGREVWSVEVAPATLVNLTPHPVVVYGGGEPILTVEPSGRVARLAETATPAVPVAGCPGTVVELGEPTGLPDQMDGATYIVSMPLLMGLLAAGVDRPDCVYPYGQVRDADGRIVGCRTLARLSATHGA